MFVSSLWKVLTQHETVTCNICEKVQPQTIFCRSWQKEVRVQLTLDFEHFLISFRINTTCENLEEKKTHNTNSARMANHRVFFCFLHGHLSDAMAAICWLSIKAFSAEHFLTSHRFDENQTWKRKCAAMSNLYSLQTSEQTIVLFLLILSATTQTKRVLKWSSNGRNKWLDRYRSKKNFCLEQSCLSKDR